MFTFDKHYKAEPYFSLEKSSIVTAVFVLKYDIECNVNYIFIFLENDAACKALKVL